MAELPSGTVTFLFTDIEGSTRLVKQLGERYGEVLVDNQRLLRRAFAEFDGQEIDTQGDAFFVAFRRARDAALAAISAQRALDTPTRRGGWKEECESTSHDGPFGSTTAPSDDGAFFEAGTSDRGRRSSRAGRA